ncbi:MAG: hypothetical protein Q7R57_05925 [Dehalococcoidales bacterium]|nr:hypothetical protein [Dehalococcoidales bacterium]
MNTFFSPGIAFGQYRDEPKVTANTITNTNPGFNPAVQARVVATHTIEYVERPVTVVEYIDRVQRVPLALRDFNNLDELKEW